MPLVSGVATTIASQSKSTSAEIEQAADCQLSRVFLIAVAGETSDS